MFGPLLLEFRITKIINGFVNPIFSLYLCAQIFIRDLHIGVSQKLLYYNKKTNFLHIKENIENEIDIPLNYKQSNGFVRCF